ncbi:MAG: roadblock/LC7 domain-containing protein [Cyanobacteria bacterium J06627_28]
MGIDTERLNQIVQSFVTETPHVQGVALVTTEGLPIAATLPPALEEARTAAMAAAVITLGDNIGQTLHRGDIEHILLEGSEGYSILTRCGSETLLMVLASAQVKQGILMLEICRVTADILEVLA